MAKRRVPGYEVRGCIECHHSHSINKWPYPARWYCRKLQLKLNAIDEYENDLGFRGRFIPDDCPLEKVEREEE